MGPKGHCSTVLSKEEEALIVAFRNLLCALQATVPHLTQSSLDRRTAQMVRLSSHTVLQYQQSMEQSEGNGRNHKQHLTLTVIRPAQGCAGTARDSEPIGVANRDHAGAPQSSASMSGKAQSPNTWQSIRLRAGTPTASHRWTSPWVRGVQSSLFGCPLARTSAPTSISCDENCSGRTVRLTNERGRTNARSR
jgi:hypothetical protein